MNRRYVRWTILIVALGLFLRAYHYWRNPSIWCDEAAVIVNVLDKTYLGLLGPLGFANNGPPLFFWGEKCAGEHLGNSNYVWRLLPFLASCAALVLFVYVGRSVLPAEAAPLAVMLLAFSDRMLWHSCEAKPYAIDVFVAIVILAVYCATRHWPLGRQMLVFFWLLPPLLFLSFPSAFLSAGVLVVFSITAWREKRARLWAGYGLLVVALTAAFLVLLLGPIRSQDSANLRMFWSHQFPQWERPWTVPAWTVFSTWEMLRYCVKPVGGLIAPLLAAGAVVLWRGGQKALVLLAAVPITLALLASWCMRYPFGHSRVEMFAAPGLMLLMAAGIQPAYRWICSRAHKRALAALALVPLLLAPALLSCYRIIYPWPRADSAAAAAYVLAHREPHDLVASDAWQFTYYFRPILACYRSWTGFDPHGADRVWVVMAHLEAGDGWPDWPALPSHEWHIAERHRFPMATVSLLERQRPQANEVAAAARRVVVSR
jgi:hypothetical protein